jgi:DNA-binding NtrC family response regulator
MFEATASPASHTATRLLFVDDDEFIARSAASLLRGQGWHVDAVGDGETALALAREGRHTIMVLDVGLPGIDGLSVLDAIHADPRAPAVILLSGYMDVARTLFALQRGAAEILEKPVEPRRLIEAVRDVERRRSDSLVDDATSGERLVPDLLGRSPAARLLREQIATVARFPDLPVMIIGETGTGKELVAQAIHRLSDCKGQLVSINCAAQPEELFESELFGHEAGSFTGANGARAGLFEAAENGTLFLDEVGEMPPSQQAKILRAVETRAFRRVGSRRELDLRARIVSATNRPLRGREDDMLRSDLFFRLAGFTIRTPPLRERMEDIEVLATVFLSRFASSHPAAPTGLSPRAVEALHAHDWPGNVRELRSVVQLAAVGAHGGLVGVRHVVEALRARGCLDETDRPLSDAAPLSRGDTPHPGPVGSLPQREVQLPDYERALITRVYGESKQNVTIAAQRIGIPRTTLRDKLIRYGLRPHPRARRPTR